MFSRILFLLLVPAIFCKHIEDGRSFWAPHTHTIKETHYETSVVPSSCIQVEPTVRPCRNLNYVRIEPKHKNDPAKAPNSKNNKTTPSNWVEYLGLSASTVNVIQKEIHTVTVQDPNIVVTYAIKGCIPPEPLHDMDRCPLQRTSSVVQNIVPTVTQPVEIVTSTTASTLPTQENIIYPDVPEARNEVESGDIIEPSTQEDVENPQFLPTEAL